MSGALSGRSAIVTGAGNGLGRAISLALAGEGASIVLLGRQPEKLEAVAAEITNLGGDAFTVLCDTSNPESVDAARDALAERPISIRINNAGVGGPVAPLTDIDPKEGDDVFAVTVRGGSTSGAVHASRRCSRAVPGTSERTSVG